jgi:HD domain
MLPRGEGIMTATKSSIEWAEDQATSLISALGNRWLHTKGVVERARHVGKVFNDADRSLLIEAAYLHDIGYAPSLNKTNFHPLDGATYLQSQGQTRLASLVAYHSGAQFEARLRDLANKLYKFQPEHSAIADALTYCDMTTGPTGLHISFEERLADIFQRYDEAHIINRAFHQAIPSLAQAIMRTRDMTPIGEILGHLRPVWSKSGGQEQSSLN